MKQNHSEASLSVYQEAEIWVMDTIECWGDHEAIGTHSQLFRISVVWPRGKTAWQFLTKLDVVLLYYQVAILLSIYVHLEIWTQMFETTLLTVAKPMGNQIVFNYMNGQIQCGPSMGRNITTKEMYH